MPVSDHLRRGLAGLRPTELGVVGLLATATAFAIVGGPIGLGIGAGLLVVGLVAPAPVTFALGQAGLLVAVPAPSLVRVAVVESVLFLVLLGPATRDEPVRLVGLAVPLFGLLGLGTWLGVARVGPLVTAVTLVVGVGLLGYVVHRYERVVLGLAGGDAA